MSMFNLHGVIRRRILVNYRVDPRVVAAQLPPGLEPFLIDGNAMAGICLIRLEHLRPRTVPAWLGASSENAAHRVAVTWKAAGGTEQAGVYIPRRDTDSKLNYCVGGRLFPGIHRLASFDVRDSDGLIEIAMKSRDDAVSVRVAGHATDEFPANSIFGSLGDASAFYEGGCDGYSDTRDPNRLDGLRLKTDQWKVQPMRVDKVESSYFANADAFPAGSVEFDCALLMRNVPHEWERTGDLVIGDLAA